MNFDNGFYVADVIMGGGKTSAAVNYINNNVNDERFIFLTPYEDEYNRIGGLCKSMVIPSDKGNYKAKIIHLKRLLKSGCNISSSHALFDKYSDEMGTDIHKHGYVLFLDEVYEVVRNVSAKEKGNIEYLLSKGEAVLNEETGDVIMSSNQDYTEMSLYDTVMDIKSNRICKYNDEYMFWVFPIGLLLAFKSVIILTYLFKSSVLRYYLDMNKVNYQYISIRKDSEGKYTFCDTCNTSHNNNYKDKIHILENKKLNSLGDGVYSLSSQTTLRDTHMNNADIVNSLGRNIRNVQKNVFRCSLKDFMWSAYKHEVKFIEDKNIKGCYVVWNKRATNDYGNRHYLAYGVNLYNTPDFIGYFDKFGISFDQDLYALSIMVQWIWRSAIRNGDEIWLYVPSSRMRGILQNWIAEVEK